MRAKASLPEGNSPRAVTRAESLQLVVRLIHQRGRDLRDAAFPQQPTHMKNKASAVATGDFFCEFKYLAPDTASRGGPSWCNFQKGSEQWAEGVPKRLWSQPSSVVLATPGPRNSQHGRLRGMRPSLLGASDASEHGDALLRADCFHFPGKASQVILALSLYCHAPICIAELPQPIFGTAVHDESAAILA